MGDTVRLVPVEASGRRRIGHGLSGRLVCGIEIQHPLAGVAHDELAAAHLVVGLRT